LRRDQTCGHGQDKNGGSLSKPKSTEPKKSMGKAESKTGLWGTNERSEMSVVHDPGTQGQRMSCAIKQAADAKGIGGKRKDGKRSAKGSRGGWDSTPPQRQSAEKKPNPATLEGRLKTTVLMPPGNETKCMGKRRRVSSTKTRGQSSVLTPFVQKVSGQEEKRIKFTIGN